MMIEVVKFKKEHIDQIKKQNHDTIELSVVSPSGFAAMESIEHSYTIIGHGRALACVGILEFWKGRGEAFAFISNDSGPMFLPMIRAIKRLIDSVDCARIEAAVIHDFKQGHRLAKLLGFELEAALMRKYGVTGLDYSLYARVK